MTAEDQPMLQGLEITNSENLGEASAMRKAVVATIEALQDAGLLQPRHVAMCQLALELADSVAAGRRSGRASAAAMASRELRETLLALPVPEEAGAAEAFENWVNQTLAKDQA
jgi:peroxiredoxin family protein